MSGGGWPRAGAALLLCAAALGGCAYTTQSSLDPRYQTIYVSAFYDQSPQYDLQAPLTTAIIRKFVADGRLRVVSHAEADLLLEGTILDYRLRGLTFDADDNVTQFLGYVSAAARLSDSAGEILWETPLIVGETTYYTRAAGQSSDRLRGNAEFFLPTVRSFPSEEENRAISEALELLASKIFYHTIEPW